jgi:hypothetical protein
VPSTPRAQFTRDVLHGGSDGGPLCAEKTLWHLDASAARDEVLLGKMSARSRRLRADIVRLEKKIKEQSEARTRVRARARARSRAARRTRMRARTHARAFSRVCLAR